jgi:hypothetical protein
MAQESQRGKDSFRRRIGACYASVAGFTYNFIAFY